MGFWEHYRQDTHEEIHHHHNHDFMKSEKGKNRKSSSRPSQSCEFCSSHWGTVVRVFPSHSAFVNSEFYGGGDAVINDPNGVEIAVWPGKNNVGRNNDPWLCAPVHPLCGCEFDTYTFRGKEGSKEELEDWYSSLEWD